MQRKLLIKEIKERRRREILSAATEAFARSGYHWTDIDVIADKLKVGKGTIYRYFPSKQKLFAAVTEAMMNQWAAEMRAGIANSANPIERLRSIINSHMRFFEKHIGLLEIFIHFRSEYNKDFQNLYLKRYTQAFKEAEKIIEHCIADGSMKPIQPKALTSILVDVFYGMLFTTFIGVSKKTFQEKGRFLEEIVINNLLQKKYEKSS